MIEKGKDLVLGKLRIIQLVETDLQLLIRIIVNIRNKGNIEENDIVSKSNYGSKTGCSIEDAILEKILFLDNSLVTGKHTNYAMTDLQACYDR